MHALMLIVRFASVILTAFMLGSIPTSYLLGKYRYGIDPREVGSGATGATNTARAMGAPAGITTALFDIFKGWLAVSIARSILVPEALFGLTAMQWAVGVALIAVIAGHAFTPWLGFRGGKGIGVAGGGLIALSAPLFFAELIILIIIAWVSGYVALGSILVALNFPLALALIPQTRHVPLIVCSVIAALFIVWLHRSNIDRLIKGTENHLTLGDATARRADDEMGEHE